ncbi:MAG: gamma-glutamyl-gamma-aminobutyrate hydrolase family protein [Acidobacteriota bacterium]|nr:gamma-glutamyl-gamma-aminobutyrate hydrolase family protein [Acidobacteriota bacterium]
MPGANSPNNSTNRPLIGITERLNAEDTFYLRRYYSEAVEAAGGIPIHIPLIPRRDYLAALCDRLDGLVLSGSNSDLDPALFGEEPHTKLGPVVPERDQTDLLLLELAEAFAMPVLAICFGMQSLNVARGGTLIQDIESHIANPIKHEQGQSYARPSHSVRLEADSLLAQLAGTESVRVNSSHHQAVAKVGRNLRVIATAPDGVIEAVIDDRADRFVLGVQWHPEIAWQQDTLSQAIFEKFIEAAVRNQER